MGNIKGFSALKYLRYMQKAGNRFLLPLFIFSFMLIAGQIDAQGSAQGDSQSAPEQDYDEISVFFSVPRVGGADISAVIRDEVLYLPITDIFTFLKIKNTYTPGFNEVSGFIISEKSTYLVDRVNNKITYNQKVYELHPGDLIRTETNLYLKSNYFGEIFELQCSFNFRSLTVTLNTKVDLPIIREMRQEQMRKNMSQIKGEIKADTTIKRSYPFLRLGMADWSVIADQTIKGNANTRLSLSLGSIIAGGEANVNLNYSNNTPFEERQQYYNWRFVNNDFKPLRQLDLGKLTTTSISTLNSPILGVQFSNSPTTYRSSFGSYTLSDFTEPGWTVELYVNNVLVDFKTADASGFYKFEVPLVYGNTSVKLQFYGPWGEERSKEQTINIPYNFLPKGNFEYNVTAGVVDDSLHNKYSRADFDYGVTRYLTVGAGVEYLSSVTSGNFMPYVNTSMRIGSNLLVSGEYTHKVRMMGIFNYRLPSDIQLELNYTKYDKNQTSINNNYREERKAALSIPFRSNKFTLFSRLSVNQIVLALTKYTTAELLFSGSIFGVNTNFTTNATMTSVTDPLYFSNLSLSFRLPAQFIFSPQTQFNYNQSKFVSAKGVLEKRISKKGYLNFSYEKNFTGNFTNIEFGFRFDMSFAQMSGTARRSNNITSFTETASGSLLYDSKSKYLSTSNRNSVGKGGITMFAFLDLNGNSKYDKHEPKAYGLQLHVNGGRVEYRERDTSSHVFDLEPYTNYLVTLDGTNFDNIAWQIKNKSFSIAVDPNHIKTLEIPITVVGEAAGTVYLGSGSSLKGQGRILVDFYGSDSKLAAQIMTESDGYFSYLGLRPGKYTACIDSTQLRKLNMTSTPSSIPITIHGGTEGDVVDGLEFILRSNSPEPAKEPVKDSVKESVKPVVPVPVTPAVKPTVTPAVTPSATPAKAAPEKVIPAKAASEKVSPVKEEQKTINHEQESANTENVNTGATLYKVQIMALRKPVKINECFSSLLYDIPGLKIEEKLESDGLYHYSSEAYNDWVKAVKLQNTLRKKGWAGSFVAVYAGEKRADASAMKGRETIMTCYRVQFIAVSNQIDIKQYFAKLLAKMPDLKIYEIKGDDGLYRYSTDLFHSLSEVKSYMRKIKENGWEDCFISIYKHQY